ncbi:protein kinase [Planomonospora sp. ID67723]|uniref:serine/threonine-protein kinase n=1 Tax=Planomonospora sp. ID67723 TaxID=2738134 RepID=UPI0018C3EBC7|nr:serine/threonine-protein kinase [Planomonospora sp. ID67723]MBG0827604.1 protein kinase [Planomonospora sp. ID67723]
MNRPDTAAGLSTGDLLTRRYLLMEPIGRGGMSVVWRAYDQILERMVAVKILDGDLGGDRELIRREARATARLIHPDAIEIYDYGETVTARGRLAAYVVMRLLQGRPLADRIAEGPLPWAEAVAVAGRLAAVLATAHERGIVHRDVTAENVLLTADGAKLLDFGIAALAGEEDDPTCEYGTPPYVAPERLTGTAADPAGDVYALGVLLFEMLTGAAPYPERTWEEIEGARRDGPPPAVHVPGLPAEVAALCRRCLSHRPQDRPGAREAAAVLSDLLSVLPDASAGGRTRARTAVLRPEHPAGVLEGPGTARIPVAAATRGWSPFRAVITVVASVAAVAASGLLWVQVTGVPREPSGSALGTASPAAPSSTAEPSAAGSPSPGPEADARTPPGGEPTAGPTREPARRTIVKPTSPVVMVEATRAPTLDQSVRSFNALLARGAKAGEIRPDVALDLRQVLAGSVCCARDLAPIRGKIADRYREGSLPGPLREALDDQLEVVANALAG